MLQVYLPFDSILDEFKSLVAPKAIPFFLKLIEKRIDDEDFTAFATEALTQCLSVDSISLCVIPFPESLTEKYLEKIISMMEYLKHYNFDYKDVTANNCIEACCKKISVDFERPEKQKNSSDSPAFIEIKNYLSDTSLLKNYLEINHLVVIDLNCIYI